MNHVGVQQEFFEGRFVAKDVLWNGSQLTVAAIDPVNLPRAVKADASFEHDC